MILIYIFISLSFGCTQVDSEMPNPSNILKPLTLNETKLVDDVLKVVKQQIEKLGLNEVHIPNANIPIGSNNISLTNGTVKNLGNIQRVGDALVTIELKDTKVRSAFGVNNVSVDQDVEIVSSKLNVSNGHLHMDVDNVTVFTVFKIEYASQAVTLDEFELSIGTIKTSITGFGDKLASDTAGYTEVVNQSKGAVLKVFNVQFKILFNAALAAVVAAAKAG